MKIALFKRLDESSHQHVGRESFEHIHGYIRISEYVDVEFPPLTSAEVVEKHLGVLDQAEQDVRNRFQAALVVIERQRQELRAIAYKPE